MRMERRGVLDEGGGRPAADQETMIHAAIRSWRESLINLTAANRLLNLPPDRTDMIQVSRPAADDVLTRLRTGGTFTFRSLKPWPDAPGAGPESHTDSADETEPDAGVPAALPA